MITSNINETKKWIRNAKRVITKAGPKKVLIGMSNFGKEMIRLHAPKGVSSGKSALRNSGVVVFKKMLEARVTFNKQNMEKAFVNEFGLSKPRYMPFDGFPNLKSWASVKYSPYKKNPKLKGMWIGEPGKTRLGKKNKFFENKVFYRMNTNVKFVVENEFNKLVEGLNGL